MVCKSLGCCFRRTGDPSQCLAGEEATPRPTARYREGGAMILSTTPNIEGKRIIRYFGLVSGEAILGANIFKDLFAGIRDIVGGRSGSTKRS